MLQLHGQEPPESLAALNLPAIKALRPRPEDDAKHVAAAHHAYQAATKHRESPSCSMATRQ